MIALVTFAWNALEASTATSLGGPFDNPDVPGIVGAARKANRREAKATVPQPLDEPVEAIEVEIDDDEAEGGVVARLAELFGVDDP